MDPDVWNLYVLMLRSRAYEEAIASLWQQGLISGEMHLGTGEEVGRRVRRHDHDGVDVR